MVFCRLFNRQISPLFSWLIALAIFVLSPSVGLSFQNENQGKSKAPEAKVSEKPTVDEDVEESLKEVLQGHSTHGEAFNEGPRQSAYLMGGTGNIHFPVTTDSKQAVHHASAWYCCSVAGYTARCKAWCDCGRGRRGCVV